MSAKKEKIKNKMSDKYIRINGQYLNVTKKNDFFSKY